jgi:hypothetical protein
MKKSLLSLIAILFLFSPLFAAEYGGVTAAPYLNLGIGARPCGMGEAYTSVVDDVEAGWWNPGALVRVTNPQFAFMHNAGFGGTSYEYLGFAEPAEQLGLDIWGTIGITALLVRVDDIDVTKETELGDYSTEQEGRAEVYGAGGTLIGLSYSWQAAKMFSVGATAKLINQKIALEEGWVPAFDVGILAKTNFPGFDVGLAFQNISFMKLNEAPLPLNLKFGVSYKAPRLFTPEIAAKDTLTMAIDGILPIIPANMPFRLHTGLEYTYDISDNIVKARVGYRFNGNAQFTSDLGPLAGLTAGGGYSRVFDGVDVALDYAFVPYGELGMTHRISMTISVGEPTPTPTPAALNPPKAVKLKVLKKKIAVSWSIENKDKYQGYNVYMSYKPGGKYYKLTKVPLNKHYLYVGPLKSGLRVYFVVAAVGKDGKESKYSKELSAVPK